MQVERVHNEEGYGRRIEAKVDQKQMKDRAKFNSAHIYWWPVERACNAIAFVSQVFFYLKA